MSFYRYCDRCGAGINSDTPEEYYAWEKLRYVAPKVYAAIDEFFSEEVIRDEAARKTKRERENRIRDLGLALLSSSWEIGRLAEQLRETMSYIHKEDLCVYNSACNALNSAKKHIEYIKRSDFVPAERVKVDIPEAVYK